MSMLLSRVAKTSPTNVREEDGAATQPATNNAQQANRAIQARAKRASGPGDFTGVDGFSVEQEKTKREALRKGDKGPAVSELQGLLLNVGLGLSIKVDGKFGKQTKAAVKSYQSSRGLKVDGVAGSQTWGALDSGAPAVSKDQEEQKAAAPESAPAPDPDEPQSASPLNMIRDVLSMSAGLVQQALTAFASALPSSGGSQPVADKPKTKPTEEKPKVVDEPAVEPKSPTSTVLSDEDQAAVEAIIGPVRTQYREYAPVAKKARKLFARRKREEYRAIKPDLVKLEQSMTAAIGAARVQIPGLGSSAARQLAFKRLNDFTAYHYQIANADILGKGGKAAGQRTCNVTVVTMCLQALGKTPNDYQAADWSRLDKIAAAFQGALEDRGEGVDAASMSMPDFMQLVAVDQFLKGEASEANIKAARNQAAKKITHMDFLHQVLDAFSVNRKTHYHKLSAPLSAFGRMSKAAKVRSQHRERRKSDATKDFAAWAVEYGRICKEALAEFAALESAVSSGSAPEAEMAIGMIEHKLAQLDEGDHTKKLRKNVKSQLDKVPSKLSGGNSKGAARHVAEAKKALVGDEFVKNMKAYKSAGSLEDMQRMVSIDDYQKGFLDKVNSAVGGGKQVIVNLYDHFVRLQSIQADGFIIDDPGTHTGESVMVPWDEAIAGGYFRKYTIVG